MVAGIAAENYYTEPYSGDLVEIMDCIGREHQNYAGRSAGSIRIIYLNYQDLWRATAGRSLDFGSISLSARNFGWESGNRPDIFKKLGPSPD